MSAARRRRRLEAPSETIAFVQSGVWHLEQSEAERFLSWEFVRWSWAAGFPTWRVALRALAVTLQGLERAGLIERRRVPMANTRRHRQIVTLTRQGYCVLEVLAGREVPADAESAGRH